MALGLYRLLQRLSSSSMTRFRRSSSSISPIHRTITTVAKMLLNRLVTSPISEMHRLTPSGGGSVAHQINSASAAQVIPRLGIGCARKPRSTRQRMGRSHHGAKG